MCDIICTQDVQFRSSSVQWHFAANRRAEIDAYFALLRRRKPKLWNGRVFLLCDFEIHGATLKGDLFETDYASFIAWRDWGCPDRRVWACFAMGALLSSDDAFLLGVMNTHTAGAGKIYFPAGMPDPQDIHFGQVDFDRSVRREVAEETGLALDGIVADQWQVVIAEQRVALIKLFRFREPATELRRRILAHLESEALPELSDIHIVRGPSDIKPETVPFVTAFLLHYWASNTNLDSTI